MFQIINPEHLCTKGIYLKTDGAVKGRTALQIFKQFSYLKQKPYWGNHFWAKGYCADTVGVDAEMMRQYVKYQEAQERQLDLDLD